MREESGKAYLWPNHDLVMAAEDGEEGGGRRHREPHAGGYDLRQSSNSRGAQHAMDGGKEAQASSETGGARRPETLRVRDWLHEHGGESQRAIP